jgi:hypothetical protein
MPSRKKPIQQQEIHVEVSEITRESIPTTWKRNIRARSRFGTNMKMFLEYKLKNR